MLAIAMGLMSNPKLLLLDEPSTGLDIGKIKLVASKLSELKRLGYNFLIVEQVLGEIVNLTDEIYIISGGILKGKMKSTELTKDKYASLIF